MPTSVFPLQALGRRGAIEWRNFWSGTCSKSETKEAKREPNVSQRAPEGNPTGVKTSHQVANMSKIWSKIKPWGFPHFYFPTFFLSSKW